MEMGGRAVPSFQLKAAEGPPGNPDPPSGPRMETRVDEVNGVWFTVCTLPNRKRKKSKNKEANWLKVKVDLQSTTANTNSMDYFVAMITELTVRFEKKEGKKKLWLA